MNVRERKVVLGQLEKLGQYNMGIHTYTDTQDPRAKELRAAMEHWESKGKAHRAQEGDGWVLWKAGKA